MKLWTKSFCIIISGLSILISSCIFKPTPADQSYYLYVGNWDYDEVFIIDTEDNAVVDTLDGFGHVWDIAVTPGGNRLYVCTREGMYNAPGAIYSVNLRTKEKSIILNSAADVYISPSGMPLVIAHIPNDTLAQVGFIDTLTDEINFFDNLNILDQGINYQNLVFNQIDSVFYTWTNQHYLFKYNYDYKEIVKNFNSESVSEEMIVSKDGRYIYFSDKIFDIQQDSIITNWEGRKGTIALSKDDKTLYITDYGYPLSHLVSPPSGLVRMFDIETNSIINSINFNEVAEHYYPHLDRMIIMPCGTEAYVSSPYELFIVNLNTNQVESILNPIGGNVWFKSLVLSKKL